MTDILHIDFETRSALDLREVGLHRYARHESTGVWCMSYAFNEDEPELWRPGMPLPDRVRQHVEAGLPVYAHNAPFELEIWNVACTKLYGWPELKPEQTYCTMSLGYAMGLPGALEDIALALGLRYLKDTMGHAIMMRACKPWKIDPDGTIHWLDECPKLTIGGVEMTGKEAIARQEEYCCQDVRVEREVHSRVMPLSARERAVWLLDYKINQRGARIDLESVKGAINLAEIVKENAGGKLVQITGGTVASATALPALKGWLAVRGVPEAQDGLAKQTVTDILARDDLLPEVRQALTIRQEVGKASTAKFDTMLNRVGKDHRIRQMYQYHGAATGRWAGRGVQTHNLVRDMPPAEQVEHILQLIREGEHEAIDMIYGPPLTMTSRCMRSFFVPAVGSQYVTGDWANVEGRGQAWFAGEDWKLKAFVLNDTYKLDAAGNKIPDGKGGWKRVGDGIYELAYSRMFGVPVASVEKEQRQVGKVAELACLAAGTPVVTNRGILEIENVTTEDLLWDGAEWVGHQGLVEKGVRQVVSVAGIKLTPDHLVLTGQTWTQAQELVSKESILQSALATGLGSSSLSAPFRGQRTAQGLKSWFSVAAALFRTKYTSVTYGAAPVRGVGNALWQKLRTLVKNTTGTPTLSPTSPIGGGYSIASPRASIDAATPATQAGGTTAGAASVSSPRGRPTAGCSSKHSLSATGGTTRFLNSTAATRTEGMSPATSGLSPVRKIKKTGDSYANYKTRWPPSSERTQTYDLAFAGPRNRFTVMSERGPLIVHNCGYQGGVGSFQQMAKVYGVKMSDAQADDIKRQWRAAHPNIVKTWKAVERAAIDAVRNPGQAFTAGYTNRQASFKMVGSFLWLKLPSQRVICFPYPKLLEGDFGPQITYMVQPSQEDRKKGKIIQDPQNSARWVRMGTYGGSLFNNIIQGMCRDFLAECMLNLDAKGADIVLHTHDSIALEVATIKCEGARKGMQDEMRRLPAWASGFPLFAECEIEARFRG